MIVAVEETPNQTKGFTYPLEIRRLIIPQQCFQTLLGHLDTLAFLDVSHLVLRAEREELFDERLHAIAQFRIDFGAWVQVPARLNRQSIPAKRRLFHSRADGIVRGKLHRSTKRQQCVAGQQFIVESVKAWRGEATGIVASAQRLSFELNQQLPERLRGGAIVQAKELVA